MITKETGCSGAAIVMTCLIGSPNDTHTSWELLGRQEVTEVTERLKKKPPMIQDCYLHLFLVAVTSEPSFPHDRMELRIEEKTMGDYFFQI